MSAHGTTEAQYQELAGRNPSYFKGPKRPVEQVSWDDTQDFVRRLNEREREARRLAKGMAYRLPTEAEWEYACRAGMDTDYSFGSNAGALFSYGWYEGNSGKQTPNVGRKRANRSGLFDMHGNVWEWCLDWHGSYGAGNAVDPAGPASGQSRVLRGGSWNSSAGYCRSVARHRGATRD